ncbi:MAG: hypothetical protein MK076_08155 [Flavobacteriales bacterium]|nr:hypothetical protein [Flavobacteriales bacterium]
MIRKTRHIKRKGIKTLATVIKIKELHSRDDGVTYKQVLEFKNVNGETVVEELDFASSIKPKKTPPFTTPIFYLNEKNKTKIILANHQIESVLGYTFLLLGMIILCVVMFIKLS